MSMKIRISVPEECLTVNIVSITLYRFENSEEPDEMSPKVVFYIIRLRTVC